jgi:hypothetical protein
MNILPATLIPTLGKLIPRLASNHDGEVVATVRAIERVLKSAGRDLHDLAACLGAPANDSDKSTVWWCYHRRHLLSQGDQRFIEGVTEQRSPLSPRQLKWLNDIVARLGSGRAA